MDGQTMALLASIFGTIIGFAGWLREHDKTVKSGEGESKEIIQRLTRIETTVLSNADDTKDVKAEIRSIKRELSDVNAKAEKAKALAEAAHDRLDALNVPTARSSRGAS